MKKRHAILGILLAFTLLLAGCTTQNPGSGSENSPAEGTSSTINESSNDADSGNTGFSYSEGIDENGLWEGITALDHVELFKYDGLSIPSDTHTISDEALETEKSSLLQSYNTNEEITNRAVADGDTVNIDYVGSVDGVEFDGGNTGGSGTEVTIGVTSYIDDFLEQLIGHMPGETFDVEVTFPDVYEQNESLQGKDAVFKTTINHIVETTEAELTDSFVSENLKDTYGWSTVEELDSGLRVKLQNTAIASYLQNELVNLATVTDTPESMIQYQQDSMIRYYEDYAAYYDMEFDEYLSTNVGVNSIDELLAANEEELNDAANYFLIIQAIAEDAGLSVTEDDVAAYFSEELGVDDYAEYEDLYGMPYLKQIVLTEHVLDYITQRAVLA